MILKDMLDLVWRMESDVLIVKGDYGKTELFKGSISEVPYIFINSEVEWYDIFMRPSLKGGVDEDGEPIMESYLTFCIKCFIPSIG